MVLAVAAFVAPLLSRSQGVTPSANAVFRRWRPNAASGGIAYVGAEKCLSCHTNMAGAQHNAMAKALEPVKESRILKAHTQLKFQNGPYSFRLVREGDRSVYTVTDGRETITAPVRWSFGQGRAGQTYVIEHQGTFYESRVSFYDDTKNLDITIGYQPARRRLSARRVARAQPARRAAASVVTRPGAVDGKQLNLEKMMRALVASRVTAPARNMCWRWARAI